MAARAIASMSLSFGLVSIPVKLYSATEQAAAIRFKLMGRGGVRLRQQYISDVPPGGAPWTDSEDVAGDEQEAQRQVRAEELRAPARGRTLKLVDEAEPEPGHSDDVPASAPSQLVERADMVKGYEFEKGKFVLFTAEELKALQAGARQTIDIVSFIPERSVDPIYYDKAYFLAPDKRGAKTYSLLLAAMRESGRCALGKWAWRSKEYVVEIRPSEAGLILQQLLYADEVRSLADLDVELVPVGQAELELALQLISQIADDSYDPRAFVDEEKQRILAAVEQKIAGRQVAVPDQSSQAASGEVVNLIAALQASLRPSSVAAQAGTAGDAVRTSARKPAKRARNVADKTTKEGGADGDSSGAKSRARR
jgi:DNA end-binding protein Ku